ncbi:MAG: LysR family transcriptional regulator [Beijerinckiaceae bacterium]|nr:LysR family transcriptional regulator [Beijerinckiaceae bacterium]
MIENLTLDQLRIFIAVSETGSFSAAARRLGRVQSAISQSMQGLESVLGTAVFDRRGKTPRLNEAGQAILGDACRLVEGARVLKARAASMSAGLEPELSVAVDAIFPSAVLMASLKAFSQRFENLPVSVFTEGLGGPEQRLRDGVVRLALNSFITTAGWRDLETEFLTRIPMIPVVASHHTLAGVNGPLTRAQLEAETQLVLTDRTPLSQSSFGGVISQKIWRFADLGTRLEYLLAGFGWCNMPTHMVSEAIAQGRLKRLRISGAQPIELAIHVAFERGRTPGPAGRWLIEDIRGRLAACPESFILK